MKVASESEKQALQQLDPYFMSDEEDAEDTEAASWVVRSPPWRSSTLSSLVKKLQDRVNSQQSSSHPKNTRLQGEPSTRHPPTSSPAGALVPANREHHQRTPSPQPSPPSRQPTPSSPQSPQSSPRRGSDGNDSDHSAEYSRVLDPSPVARHRTKRVRNLRD